MKKLEPAVPQTNALYLKDWLELREARKDLKQLDVPFPNRDDINYFTDGSKSVYFVRQDFAHNATGFGENQVVMVNVVKLEGNEAIEVLKKRPAIQLIAKNLPK